MISAFFWVVMQSVGLNLFLLFMGANVRGGGVKKSKNKVTHCFYFFGILDHLKMILIVCPETRVNIYHYTLRDNPEERRYRSKICFLKIIKFEWYLCGPWKYLLL
jgi:hypothetical protein